MTIENIDVICANVGLKLSEDADEPKSIENRLTKTIGVLEEQGVYAMFLYLFAREERKGVAELVAILEKFCAVSEASIIVNKLCDLKNKLEDVYKGGRGKKRDPEVDDIKRQIRKEKNGFFTKIEKLSSNLDDLLFARELLNRTLVYGRYHAKARTAMESRG